MKTYQISVICSDATTYSRKILKATKKDAENHLNGVADLYQIQGKKIFTSKVELIKNPY